MEKFSLNKLKDLLDDNVIDLSAHDLETVPKALMQLPRATDIDLSQNKISSLPTELCDMTRIVKLDLGNNNLAILPHNFGNLVRLEYLNLYNNQIEELPHSFANLRSLKWLDLGRNDLEPELGKAIGECKNDKECKEAAIKAVAFVKAQVKTLQEVKEKQAALNQKIQEKKLAAERERKLEKQNNDKKKKAKKETVQQQPTESEVMAKHHHNNKHKHHEVANEKEVKPGRGLIGYLLSLIKFVFKWSMITLICLTLCATLALSTDCYSTGGSIPNSKSLCTDLTKMAKFKAPSENFVQHAQNAYGTVFNSYNKQFNELTVNTRKIINAYYKKSTFTKDAKNFLYKCHTTISHYVFYVFTVISDMFSNLQKWYETDGKKIFGWIVEPVQVCFKMIYEVAKDIFFVVADFIGKHLSNMTIFLERIFTVWSEKGLSAAIDAAFQH